jgi:hypothetical protein
LGRYGNITVTKTSDTAYIPPFDTLLAKANYFKKRLLTLPQDNAIDRRARAKRFLKTERGVGSSQKDEAAGGMLSHKAGQFQRRVSIMCPLRNADYVRLCYCYLPAYVSCGPAGEIRQCGVETGFPQTGMKRADPRWQQTDVGILTFRHP